MKKALCTFIFLILSVRTAKEMSMNTVFIILSKPKVDEKKVEVTTKSLEVLHPVFKYKLQQFLDSCKRACIELDIIETYRTNKTQNNYYHKKGRKVTRLKAGQSKHQHGLAVDVVPVVNGKWEWNNRKIWKTIGSIGEYYGLRWGGRWKNPYDPSHFEMTFSAANICITSDEQTELSLIKDYWKQLENEEGP